MKLRHLWTLVALAAGGVIAGCGSASSSSSSASASTSAASPSSTTAPSGSTGQLGFEGVPIETGALLAPASTTQSRTVDGISCAPTEQLVYHIHAHLAVYVNGAPRALPGGIGIPGSRTVLTSLGPVAAGGRCIYWLHTHAPDGIIHVESPTERVYTLANFFNEWHQPLSSSDVAGVHGKVTAIIDGKPWTASPRATPILPHEVIQLNVGSASVPFQPMSWSGLRL